MKRFMMAAALFGAMTLGACVDNQESQSVTDIRDAKTEELKSQAALNNAAAEATKIMANAEAALKNAQAEVEKATAKQIEAQTALLEVEAELAAVKVELKEAELEAKVAELEALKAEYEQRITEAQAAIAKAEAQLEIDLAKAEYDLLVQQKNVITAAQNLEAAQKIHYITLYNKYSEAVKTLNEARVEVILANKHYVDVEEGFISAKESALDLIEGHKQDIAEYEKKIAYFEAKKALFEEYVTLTDAELEAKIAEKMAEFDPALTNYTLADLAYDRYCEANPEPEMPEIVEEYESYINFLFSEFGIVNNDDCWGASKYVGIDNLKVKDGIALGYEVPSADPDHKDFVPVFEKNSYYFLDEEWTELEGGEGYYAVAPTKSWVINEENFEAYLAAWGKALEGETEGSAMVEDAEAALEAAEEAAAEAAEAYEAALAAWAEKDETIAAAEAAYEAAEAAVEAAKANVTAMVDGKAAAEENVTTLRRAKNLAATAEGEAKEAWETAVEALANDKTNDALVKAAAEAYEDYLAAKTAYDEALAALETAKAALKNYDEEVIEAAEEALAEAEAALAELVDPTTIEDELHAAVTAAHQAKIAADGVVNSKKQALEYAQGFVNADVEAYENACAAYESLKEMQAAIDSEETYAEYNAYWPAHYASEEYIAYAEATEALDAISTEIEALRDAYAADDDYEYHVNFLAEQIESLEADIETANAAIEALEATCELGKEGSELFLAELQKGIDMLELKVAAAQKEVDEAKAKLDAALAE